MYSLILITAARYLLPLLLLFSFFLLIRGHNWPGGGFIGGLVAAAAYTLHLISFEAAQTRRAIGLDPRQLIALGLGTATISGLIGVLGGRPFQTGLWLELPVLGHLGTPLLFDVGVYLVVIGAVMLIIFTLAEES